jgi:hypothetical protein
MRLTLEVEGGETVTNVPGEGAELVALMSFATMRGFGATHSLAALADRLQALNVPLGPLTTFYEREPEDAEDREKLELAWQQPSELAESLRRLASALQGDELARTLARRGNAESVADQAEALLPALEHAAAQGARVRLVYDL